MAQSSQDFALSSAVDTSLDSPSAGDVLTYDSTLAKWKNQPSAAAGTMVRADTSQSLSAGEQTTARNNIGAISASEAQASFIYNPSVAQLSAMPAGTYYVTGA